MGVGPHARTETQAALSGEQTEFSLQFMLDFNGRLFSNSAVVDGTKAAVCWLGRD